MDITAKVHLKEMIWLKVYEYTSFHYAGLNPSLSDLKITQGNTLSNKEPK